MEPFQEAFRIREEISVPGIAGPAASVFGINVYQMPVHIDHCHGKGDLLLFKTLHQLFVSFLCIFIIPAPPVSKSISGNHRAFSAEIIEVFKSLFVVMSVAPEIQVFLLSFSWFDPSVFSEEKRLAVI